jgi:sporulation integral membrane protein YtvI
MYNVKNNYSKALKVFILLSVLAILSFLVFKFIFLLVPFLVAYVLSSLIEPLIRFFTTKNIMSRKTASLSVLIFLLFIFGFFVFFVISKLLTELIYFTNNITYYSNSIILNVENTISQVQQIYFNIPKELNVYIQETVSRFIKGVLNFLEAILSGILNTAISLPESLLFLIVVIMSTYFFLSDKEHIQKFLSQNIPEKWLKKTINIKTGMFTALLGYVKAQIILMAITFAELSIGFLILRFNYAFLLAFLVSIVDALPIFGVGTILIPMSIYDYLLGNNWEGTFIIILFGIIIVIRQIIEPKIVGDQLGIHPLITIATMYIGLKLFGLIGFILSPFIAIFIKNTFLGLIKIMPIKKYLEKI